MKIENYKVLALDRDGTVQLLNLDMAESDSKNATIWCMADIELEEGEVVRGMFDFDPSESLLRGYPTFIPFDENARYEGRVIAFNPPDMWRWSIDNHGMIVREGIASSEELARAEVTKEIRKIDPEGNVWPGTYVNVGNGRFSYRPSESS